MCNHCPEAVLLRLSSWLLAVRNILMDAGLGEDDPLRDVADMVADSLEILRDIHQLKGAAAVSRVVGNHLDD